MLAVVAVLVAAGAGASASDGPRRLDDLRWLGTHNSYHVRPDRAITPGEEADYAHPPLDVQLSKQGIRSLELDTWNAPDFPVFHSLIVDTGSTCPTLEDCFRTVDRWSDAHPKAQTLVLFVEGKVLPVNANPSVQGAVDAAAAEQGITNWDAAGFDRLDALVRRVFGSKLIVPDDVRGKRRTLRAAVVRDGWPTVARGRGKVIVTLIGRPEELDLYRANAPALAAPGDVHEREAHGPRRGDHLPRRPRREGRHPRARPEPLHRQDACRRRHRGAARTTTPGPTRHSRAVRRSS